MTLLPTSPIHAQPHPFYLRVEYSSNNPPDTMEIKAQRRKYDGETSHTQILRDTILISHKNPRLIIDDLEAAISTQLQLNPQFTDIYRREDSNPDEKDHSNYYGMIGYQNSHAQEQILRIYDEYVAKDRLCVE